jgi:hypothetical protein
MTVPPVTYDEISAALQQDTLLNRVRRIFVDECFRIDQAVIHGPKLEAMDVTRMDFEAAAKIIACMREGTTQ